MLARRAAWFTGDRSRCVQHMQKALAQMNPELDSVLSDIGGKTGRRIIRAIVAGERDGARLAKLRDRRAEHLLSLELAHESCRRCSGRIERLEQSILAAAERLAAAPGGEGEKPGWERQMREAMRRAFGVDLAAVPSIGTEAMLTIFSEVGPDFSMFPGESKFCQWLGLAPDASISGGKRLGRAKGRGGAQIAGQSLRVCAMCLRRDQSPLGDRHRGRCAIADPPRAIKASARQLARIVYAMAAQGKPCSEEPARQAELRRRQAEVRQLFRQAKRPGFDVLDKDGDIIRLEQTLART